MTDDIVTRLREEYDYLFNEWQIIATVLPNAADEIERLRADVMYWKALPYCPKCGCGTCQDNEQVLNNE